MYRDGCGNSRAYMLREDMKYQCPFVGWGEESMVGYGRFMDR